MSLVQELLESVHFARSRVQAQLLCLSRAINKERLRIEDVKVDGVASMPDTPRGDTRRSLMASLEEGQDFYGLFASLLTLCDLIIAKLVDSQVGNLNSLSFFIHSILLPCP